jgi:hypothetical protein
VMVPTVPAVMAPVPPVMPAPVVPTPMMPVAAVPMATPADELGTRCDLLADGGCGGDHGGSPSRLAEAENLAEPKSETGGQQQAANAHSEIPREPRAVNAKRIASFRSEMVRRQARQKRLGRLITASPRETTPSLMLRPVWARSGIGTPSTVVRSSAGGLSAGTVEAVVAGAAEASTRLAGWRRCALAVRSGFGPAFWATDRGGAAGGNGASAGSAADRTSGAATAGAAG